MVYNYVHYFPPYEASYLTDEQKLEIAKDKAAHELAKELLEHATWDIEKDGCVRVKFVIY